MGPPQEFGTGPGRARQPHKLPAGNQAAKPGAPGLGRPRRSRTGQRRAKCACGHIGARQDVRRQFLGNPNEMAGLPSWFDGAP